LSSAREARDHEVKALKRCFKEKTTKHTRLKSACQAGFIQLIVNSATERGPNNAYFSSFPRSSVKECQDEAKAVKMSCPRQSFLPFMAKK
jgi:hypothetical protein